jgi:hypothetical protein
MRTNRLLLGALTFVLCGAAGKCGGGGGDDGAASSAEGLLDSTEALSTEGGLLAVSVDDADGTLPADMIATNAAAKAQASYTPSGCVAATVNAAHVTYVLSDCTGPFGLVHVSGTVEADYTVDTAGVHVHATGSGLMANQAVFDLDATGVFKINGMTRQLHVTTMSSGTGARDVMFTRQGDYDLTWDEGAACMDLAGTWSTTIGALSWSTTVANYTRCAGGCPMNGASLTTTIGANGFSVTITWDGTAVASWSTSKGRHGTITLTCTP